MLRTQLCAPYWGKKNKEQDHDWFHDPYSQEREYHQLRTEGLTAQEGANRSKEREGRWKRVDRSATLLNLTTADSITHPQKALVVMRTTSPTIMGVTGARGRMGAAVVEAVSAAPGMELAAAIDIGDSLDELVAQSCDVVIDFTTPDAVMGNLEFAIDAGMHCVVGTTGFDDDRLARVKEWTAGHPGCWSTDRPELQHRCCPDDAPIRARRPLLRIGGDRGVASPRQGRCALGNGRAHRCGDRPRDRGSTTGPDATLSQLDGARGARVDDIPVHSIRLRGLVAHQEVLFGGPGETLSIRHDSLDRGCFMPGVILAARRVSEHPGVTVGLADYLDL